MTPDNGQERTFREFLDRKYDLLLLDFETAFEWTQHIDSQISNLRSWTITLLLAYAGFLFTQQTRNDQMLLPLMMIPIPFVFLEIYRRMHFSFLGDEVRRIEQMFMVEDNQEFERHLRAYVFRDLKLPPYSKSRHELVRLFKYLPHSFLSFDSLSWYGLLVISIAIIYISFKT